MQRKLTFISSRERPLVSGTRKYTSHAHSPFFACGGISRRLTASFLFRHYVSVLCLELLLAQDASVPQLDRGADRSLRFGSCRRRCSRGVPVGPGHALLDQDPGTLGGVLASSLSVDLAPILPMSPS